MGWLCWKTSVGGVRPALDNDDDQEVQVLFSSTEKAESGSGVGVSFVKCPYL